MKTRVEVDVAVGKECVVIRIVVTAAIHMVGKVHVATARHQQLPGVRGSFLQQVPDPTILDTNIATNPRRNVARNGKPRIILFRAIAMPQKSVPLIDIRSRQSQIAGQHELN